MRGFLLVAGSFLLSTARCSVVWDGRFNDYSTSTDIDTWSWSNEVGDYQWYIHGTGPTTEYFNLSPSYKNPADTVSNQGAKLTIDSTALWNSQMWRTELIPQTTANLGTGTMAYHFSVKRSDTNAPDPAFEHQVCFFESHFTEIKFGWVNGNSSPSPVNKLQWFVGSQSAGWSVDWDADTWHNFAFDINFSGGTVSLYHSTGSDNLALVAGPKSASTSTNSEDWHLGILRLPTNAAGTSDSNPEDWYFSGVYIESGSVTTTVAGPPWNGGAVAPVSSGSGSSSTTAPASSSTRATTTTSVSSPTSASSTPTSTGAVAQKYGQCGGIGWTGPTACASGSTCTDVNDYYYQCL